LRGHYALPHIQPLHRLRIVKLFTVLRFKPLVLKCSSLAQFEQACSVCLSEQFFKLAVAFVVLFDTASMSELSKVDNSVISQFCELADSFHEIQVSQVGS
jgi:hypothetical protein